jgi:hypothetical protein
VQAAQVIRTARELVGELTGLKVENVTGLERDGDDWVVLVEVLELERVPTTMDVLGSYEIVISGDGDVSGFRRRRRYPRSATDGEG